MRRLLLAVFLLLIAAPVASAAAPSILYSADAKTATISGSRISMPANTHVTWFTDRPSRKAGITTLAGLSDIWAASGFAADPPNAAVIVSRDGKARTHVLELTRPRHRKGQVSFRFRVIPNGVEAGRRAADAVLPGTYRRTELFIDDAAYPPCVPGFPEFPTALVWDYTACVAGPGAFIFADAMLNACGLSSPSGAPFTVTISDQKLVGFWPGVTSPISACPAVTPLPIALPPGTSGNPHVLIGYPSDQSILFLPQ